MPRSTWTLLCSLALFACSDSSGAGDEPDASGDGSVPDTEEDTAWMEGCDAVGFEPAYGFGTASGGGIIRYYAFTAEDFPLDYLRVAVNPDGSGAKPEPGTYSLAGLNNSDCLHCVLLVEGCGGGTECDRYFFARSGEITTTSQEGEGGRLVASLHDVLLEEVTLDMQTGASTPVEGGETRCLPDYSFDEEVLGFTDGNCAKPFYTCIGETVADFSLTSCETGEPVAMSTLAADKKALWFFATAGW